MGTIIGVMQDQVDSELIENDFVLSEQIPRLKRFLVQLSENVISDVGQKIADPFLQGADPMMNNIVNGLDTIMISKHQNILVALYFFVSN